MTKKSILAGSLSALLIVVLGLSIVGEVWQEPSSFNQEPGYKILANAYLDRQSGMGAEVQGDVTRLIMDDQRAAQEQKFVIHGFSGQALLVSHDLGKSERVPVAVGDQVTVRGEYRWSEPGGMLVWTTADGPKERQGWIEHKGKYYD